MLTLTNRIDMRPGAVPLIIHLGQYDSDFSLVFELYSSAGNFTVESGTTAMIRGTKTDGNAYDADATIDVSAKTVTVAGSEQMTAAKGRNVYELVLTKSGKVLSTANFILDVERAAMDADTIASESVLKELNAIIAGAATATEAAADAAAAADRAEDAADSVSSASAQIATNASDIADLKIDFKKLKPLSEEVKKALYDVATHIAIWSDENGEQYVQALYDALYPESGLVRINAVFSQSGAIIYADTPLADLKAYLTVTGYYNDGTSDEITDYALSGTLAVGTSTITVIAEGKTTTFDVVVSAPYWDYEWNASSGVAPVSIDGNPAQGTFVDGMFKLAVVTDTEFIFAESRPIECEIEWMTPSKVANFPYFAFCYQFANERGSGFKALRSGHNDNWSTTLSGALVLSDIAVPTGEVSTVRAVCKSDGCQVDLDGNTITGSGVVNNQYLLGTSIGYATEDTIDFRIKAIRYKYL